ASEGTLNNEVSRGTHQEAARQPSIQSAGLSVKRSWAKRSAARTFSCLFARHSPAAQVWLHRLNGIARFRRSVSVGAYPRPDLPAFRPERPNSFTGGPTVRIRLPPPASLSVMISA